MDLFGKAPFKEHFSEELLVEKNRADLFAYIESMNWMIENDMYTEPGKAPYGRADRAANWLLRTRMNLNAEVYTGTAQWGEAAEYATVIGSGYDLCDNYKELFMADNGENPRHEKRLFSRFVKMVSVQNLMAVLSSPVAATRIAGYRRGNQCFLVMYPCP